MTPVQYLDADLAAAVPQMLRRAIKVVVEKLHLAGVEDALDHLHRDQPEAVAYFRHALARQAARLLLTSDPYVLGIYEEQDVPEGEELPPSPPSLVDPLQLYARVERETAALRALIAALDQAMVAALAQQFHRPAFTYLNVLVVDASQEHLLRPRAGGYRPAPALVLAREALGREARSSAAKPLARQ